MEYWGWGGEAHNGPGSKSGYCVAVAFKCC